MNMKYMNRINRMKNTRIGKIVCRLMGEEKGQAMMEYVIIAISIAAALVLILAIVGKAMYGQYDGVLNAIIGRPNKAADLIDKNRDITDKGRDEAHGNTTKIHSDGDIQTPTPGGNGSN